VNPHSLAPISRHAGVEYKGSFYVYGGECHTTPSDKFIVINLATFECKLITVMIHLTNINQLEKNKNEFIFYLFRMHKAMFLQI
jgi:hypothetical protein